jgi:thymidylate kinase
MNTSVTTGTPKDVFERYIGELERREVRYVILHSYENFPDRFESDVDHAVLDYDLPKIWGIQAEVAEQCGWILALTIHYQSCAFHTVLINPGHPTDYLQLDVCSHYLSHGCRLVRDRDLLQGRSKHKGFYIPSTSSEFIYRLARVLAKQKRVSEHLPKVSALWNEDRESASKLWVSLLGADAGSFEDWSRRPSVEWSHLRSWMIARNGFNPYFRLREWQRLLRRIVRPIGIRVAVLGPDGAGKSTLLPQIETLLRPCMRGQRVVHFCPIVIGRSTSAIVTQPHAQPPRSAIMSWIKISYYFASYWLDFFKRGLRDRVKGVCTIFDRDFDDMLVDPKRYRVQHSALLVQLLRQALPKLELTVILDAPPEVLRQRKTELTLDELRRQRAALQELAASNVAFAVVSAEQPAEAVARDAVRAMILTLGAREKRRASSSGR